MSNYTYDEANHLIAFDNPVLRESGHEILYTYNYNQLTKITYPDHIVKYEYGLPGAVNNGAGRLIKQTDRTGIQMFKYSRLGQLTEEKRFMIAPNETAKVFKTSYDYDVYNRINKIVYPDNEEVLYSYNPFGLLNGIQSIMPTTGATSNIVSSISYDYNDQMTSVTAGNGTVTEYQRDPWGRLEKLMLNAPISLTSLGEIIRSNAYTYDKDNNVTGIITAVPMGINNTVLNGVASEKTFTYDGFNRLKTSLIKATGPDEKKYYQLDMAYNNSHGIASKHSRWKTYRSDVCSNPAKEGANMVYHYDDTNHPNAVSSITSTIGGRYTTPWDCGTGFNVSAMDTNEYYTYDANGNMTLVENEASQDPFSLPERTVKRQLFWDTQNHLKGIAQDNALHHYVYDAGGERSLKSEGIVRNIFTNGNVGSGRPRTTMEPYTYYPNGYAVVNGAQLSKHYYIGSNKIAAKVTDLPSHGFASELTPTLNELSATSMREVESMIQEAGYPPVAWANIDDSTLETEEICSNAVLAAASRFNFKTNCYKKIMAGYNAALQTGTVCEFWHNFQLDDCMINQPNDEEQESQTYWVHPDHLGSGSVITNQAGITTNWYEYMPFGEMLMEQSSGDYNNVYKYNGKELDEATGLYYYGARYYDPNTSVWLSVDPLANKYPNYSPYIYTFNNPIGLIDPDGRDPIPTKVIIARLNAISKMNVFNKAWNLSNHGNSSKPFWMDMIYNTSPKEYSFVITAGPRNKYFARNLYTNNLEGKASTNFDIPKNEKLLAKAHTHPYEDESLTGVGFSGKDLQSMKNHLNDVGFSNIVEAGTKRFAVTIMDSDKAKKYFKDNNLQDLYNEKFDSLGGEKMTFQERVLESIKAAVGDSSNSGLKIFITNDKKKQNFVEIK